MGPAFTRRDKREAMNGFHTSHDVALLLHSRLRRLRHVHGELQKQPAEISSPCPLTCIAAPALASKKTALECEWHLPNTTLCVFRPFPLAQVELPACPACLTDLRC